MPTLKFAVPETWHEPIAHAPVLSERRLVAAYYDFPGCDGIAEEDGVEKRDANSSIIGAGLRNTRTRPFYSRGHSIGLLEINSARYEKPFGVVIDDVFETYSRRTRSNNPRRFTHPPLSKKYVFFESFPRGRKNAR